MLKSVMIAAAVLAATGAADAQPANEFFQGKQIRFVLGAAPGQDYDVWARFLARHLPRHIPGHPTFVVQNMPGAGHMRAANWLYNIAPRDGTVWGSVSRNIPAVGLQHLSGVQFDPLKFNWIGSPELTNRGCIAMANNPRVKSAAPVRTRAGGGRHRRRLDRNRDAEAPARAPRHEVQGGRGLRQAPGRAVRDGAGGARRPAR